MKTRREKISNTAACSTPQTNSENNSKISTIGKEKNRQKKEQQRGCSTPHATEYSVVLVKNDASMERKKGIHSTLGKVFVQICNTYGPWSQQAPDPRMYVSCRKLVVLVHTLTVHFGTGHPDVGTISLPVQSVFECGEAQLLI